MEQSRQSRGHSKHQRLEHHLQTNNPQNGRLMALFGPTHHCPSSSSSSPMLSRSSRLSVTSISTSSSSTSTSSSTSSSTSTGSGSSSGSGSVWSSSSPSPSPSARSAIADGHLLWPSGMMVKAKA